MGLRSLLHIALAVTFLALASGCCSTGQDGSRAQFEVTLESAKWNFQVMTLMESSQPDVAVRMLRRRVVYDLADLLLLIDTLRIPPHQGDEVKELLREAEPIVLEVTNDDAFFNSLPGKHRRVLKEHFQQVVKGLR